MAFGPTFERVAPILMADLVKILGLTPNQSCGFCRQLWTLIRPR